MSALQTDEATRSFIKSFLRMLPLSLDSSSYFFFLKQKINLNYRRHDIKCVYRLLLYAFLSLVMHIFILFLFFVAKIIINKKSPTIKIHTIIFFFRLNYSNFNACSATESFLKKWRGYIAQKNIKIYRML